MCRERSGREDLTLEGSTMKHNRLLRNHVYGAVPFLSTSSSLAETPTVSASPQTMKEA